MSNDVSAQNAIITAKNNGNQVLFWSKDFLNQCLVKLTATFISVKVWMILVAIIAPLWLITHKYITGTEYVNITVGTYGIMAAAREAGKVFSVSSYASINKSDDQEGG